MKETGDGKGLFVFLADDAMYLSKRGGKDRMSMVKA